MPLTRIRQTAIGNDTITTAKLDDTSGGFTLPGVQYVRVPVGTTAQRPTGASGYLRFNTNLGILEQWNTTINSWQAIDSPPIITSVAYAGSATAADPAGGETITLTGSNFQTGATVTIGGTSATSVTVVSTTSITLTTPAKTAGDYDVVVTNSNGLSATSTNGISYNGTPSFTTAAGNVGSITEDVAMSTITIVAAEPDGGTLAYSITSGALPTGVSMSSAGAITGTPNVNPSADTTFNFTVTATDDENQTNSRAFNLIVLRPIFSYNIPNSLRFDGTSSFLMRTEDTAPTSTTQTTFSAWIKRGDVGQGHIWTAYNSNVAGYIYFDSNDKIVVYLDRSSAGSDELNVTTDARFRDPAAWYHVVVKYDVGQAANSDKVKIYVNGNLQSATYSQTGSAVDAHRLLSSGTINRFGQSFNGSSWFDGYMAELYIIDGQVKEPTDFAETFNGVWTPKAYAGTFGNNGIHLPFTQGSSSGNSHFFSDAGNSYVEFSDASYYDIGGSDDFTIEFFFNLTDTGKADYSYIFGNYVGTSGPYMSVQFANSANSFYFYYGNGQSYSMPYGAGNVVANRWHHLAINRSSGTLEAWLDGTRIYNGTSNTQAWDNNNVRIGMAQSNGTNGFDGYLSNVRMVVGSAVYNPGTTINVPISTLTNVTNTKLLALTTSTITEDASSNNVTGTVSGSGNYSSTLAPFGDQFYADNSGNSNNYNPTNLSITDLPPDSPTNNFATLNPLYAGTSPTLSEGALKFDSTGWSSTVWGSRSTIPIPKDKKIYIEIENTTEGGANWAAGIATESSAPSGTNVGGTGSVTVYQTQTYVNGSSSVTSGAGSSGYSGGDILGIAVDGATGKVWFSHNGTWYTTGGNVGNPSAGTDPVGTVTNTNNEDLFLVVAGNAANNNLFVNFGQDTQNISSAVSPSDGIGSFEYDVPTGHIALCAKNLSESTINTTQDDRPEDYMGVTLWQADVSNPTAGQKSINVGFQPDLVWSTDRSAGEHIYLIDSVRGDGDGSKLLRLPGTNAEGGDAVGSTSAYYDFTSTGFDIIDSDSGTGEVYYNSRNYVGWTWKAGGAPTASNVATSGAMTANSVSLNGTLQSSYTPDASVTQYPTKMSINTKAGFSIVGWTGNGSAGTWLPHGLNSTPEMMMLRGRDARVWSVYHKDLTSAAYYLQLNSSNGESADNAMFNSVAPNNVRFVVGSYNVVTNVDYIGYFWHSVPGFSKIGKFTGNTAANGPHINLGFRPAFILIKSTGAGTSWCIYDNKRLGYNVDNNLQRIAAAAEQTDDDIDFLSNGFKIRRNSTNFNSGTLLYMAFAENPFKYSAAR